MSSMTPRLEPRWPPVCWQRGCMRTNMSTRRELLVCRGAVNSLNVADYHTQAGETGVFADARILCSHLGARLACETFQMVSARSSLQSCLSCAILRNRRRRGQSQGLCTAVCALSASSENAPEVLEVNWIITCVKKRGRLRGGGAGKLITTTRGDSGRVDQIERVPCVNQNARGEIVAGAWRGEKSQAAHSPGAR